MASAMARCAATASMSTLGASVLTPTMTGAPCAVARRALCTQRGAHVKAHARGLCVPLQPPCSIAPAPAAATHAAMMPCGARLASTSVASNLILQALREHGPLDSHALYTKAKELAAAQGLEDKARGLRSRRTMKMVLTQLRHKDRLTVGPPPGAIQNAVGTVQQRRKKGSAKAKKKKKHKGGGDSRARQQPPFLFSVPGAATPAAAT